MYRIVKRIVHTITTVTWLVRLEGESADGKPLEKEITFPATVSLTEEVVETKNKPNKHKKPTPIPINGSKGGRSIRNRTTQPKRRMNCQMIPILITVKKGNEKS